MKYISGERLHAAGRLMRTLWILFDHAGESMGRSTSNAFFEYAYYFIIQSSESSRPEPLEKWEIYDFVDRLPDDEVCYQHVEISTERLRLEDLDDDDFACILLCSAFRFMELGESHGKAITMHGINKALDVVGRLKHFSLVEMLNDDEPEKLRFQAYCRRYLLTEGDPLLMEPGK